MGMFNLFGAHDDRENYIERDIAQLKVHVAQLQKELQRIKQFLSKPTPPPNRDVRVGSMPK